MNSNKIEYKIDDSKYIDIIEHLKKCDKNFSPLLSSYVNIEEYSKKIRKNAVTFEAWSENKLVGLVACYLNDQENLGGFISNVSVLESHSKRGIGKQILKNCEKYAYDQKFKSLSLEVEKSNDKAISLYRKIGFTFHSKVGQKHNMKKRINEVNPLLSICCATYNHEDYIGDALEGFLMQETDFPFEILIHDDASTDETAKIIKEYEEKYPDIIKPIYQSENQYSQDVSISATYNFPRAKGKYIALCEGDDFWTESNKLQTQVNYLEEHPSFSACYHPINWIESDKDKNTIYAPTIEKEYYDENNVFENILQITLCSTVLRTKTLENHLDDFKTIPYADNLIHILNARNGFIGYLPKVMATYRRHSGGVYSGASKYIRLINTIRSLDFIKNKFAYHNNKFLKNRLKVLYRDMSMQSQKICQNNSIEYQKNKFSKIEKAKPQNNVTKIFTLALQKFTEKEFASAERSLHEYKTKINYNYFERYDNRVNGNPKLSVVVVAYNTAKLLIECLSSVYKNQSEDFELIVVDNGGNDLVEEKLKALALLYIKCPINFVLSEGRNIGVHFAKGKIVAFLDDDSLVPVNYISSIIEVFEKYDILGIRGKVLPKTENKNNQLAGHYNLGDTPVPASIDAEGNSAFLKSAYRSVGGMNPLLFGGEGTELSYRLAEKYSIYCTIYNPTTIIYHDYAITDDKLNVKSSRHELMRSYMLHLHKDIYHYHNSLATFSSNQSSRLSGEKKIPKHIKSNENIFITICIPTYNRATYLKDAISSALNQNYQNYEILIVDDGSDDNTSEIVESFKSEKIRFIQSEKNIGRPKIRNKLIANSRGNYLLWLDDDDMLKVNILANYVRILEEYSEVNIIYGNLLQFEDATGAEIQKYEPFDYFESKEDLLQNFILGSGLTFPGSLIKKELFNNYGNFDEEYLRAQDNELWTRICEGANFYKIDEIVVLYRKHSNNVSFSEIIDKSYEAKTIKKILSTNSLQEIFKNFNLFDSLTLDKIYYNIAYSLFNFQDFYNAINYLEKIKNKKIPEYFELILESYLMMGDINSILSKLTKSKEEKTNIAICQSYEQKIENYERKTILLNQIIEQNSWEKFNALIEEMISEIGYVADIPYYLGVLCEVVEDNEAALKYYSQAIRFNPNNNDFYQSALQVAKIAEKQNNLEKMRNRILFRAKDSVFARQTNQSEQAIVSVIIPTYNRPMLLKDAIDSVLNQKYQNFEIIVINDAGENIDEVRKEFTDDRIRFLAHKTNKGLSASRNTGIKNAQGKYIVFLDDDDIFYPNHLDVLVSNIEKSDYKIMYSDAKRVFQKATKDKYISVSEDIPFSFEFDKLRLLYMNIAPIQSFIIEKSILNNEDLFDEALGTHEDYDFWLKLSLKYDFKHLPIVTSEFRLRLDMSNMTNYNSSNMLSTLNTIYDRYAGYHPNSSKIKRLQNSQKTELLNSIKKQGFSDVKFNKKVSIIIPLFNKLELTKNCIESLYTNTLVEIFELILVDNNSTDGTKEYLAQIQKKYSNIKIIYNSNNIGFAKANNLGVKNAVGEYLLLLNNDTEVNIGWLEPLIEILDNDFEVGAVGSKLIYPNGKIQHAGVVIVNDKINKDPLLAKHVHINSDSEKEELNKPKVYQALTAACLLIRKSYFNFIGGFDVGFWNGYEDVDLCFKLREHGAKLVYQPQSCVVHYESQSGSERFSRVNENIKRLHQKWLNVAEPDFILESNGKLTKTNANIISEYTKNSPKKLDFLYRPTLSIIIPTFNKWEYTKQVIESIQNTVNLNYEIIIVDNASTDSTLENLSKYNYIKTIINPVNQGFPIAINQGILDAKGSYILLANNDIVFTEGWLERMIEIAEQHPEVGIVGPISNSVSGRQLDKNAKYKSIPEMHKYAAKVKKEHKGEFFQFPRVAFLCTLIKKEVIDKIGGLDERYSPGNFEDDDFCLRAQMAGYKTVIATDVFIHHYGSVSFKANGEDKYAKRIETNKQKFIAKWGADPEEIWIKGIKPKERTQKFAINSDIFIQHIERALTNIDDNEPELSIENLEIAISNYNKSNRKGYENLVLDELIVILGNLYIATNNLEKAKESFENALNENPNSSLACQGLGEIFFSIEEYEASKTMFEWAAKNDQNNDVALEKLIEVNILLGLEPNDFSLSEE